MLTGKIREVTCYGDAGWGEVWTTSSPARTAGATDQHGQPEPALPAGGAGGSALSSPRRPQPHSSPYGAAQDKETRLGLGCLLNRKHQRVLRSGPPGFSSGTAEHGQHLPPC